MEEIDYKELLTKYIAHIRDCEGIDFIDTRSNVDFSEHEDYALYELSKEYDKYC